MCRLISSSESEWFALFPIAAKNKNTDRAVRHSLHYKVKQPRTDTTTTKKQTPAYCLLQIYSKYKIPYLCREYKHTLPLPIPLSLSWWYSSLVSLFFPAVALLTSSRLTLIKSPGDQSSSSSLLSGLKDGTEHSISPARSTSFAASFLLLYPTGINKTESVPALAAASLHNRRITSDRQQAPSPSPCRHSPLDSRIGSQEGGSARTSSHVALRADALLW